MLKPETSRPPAPPPSPARSSASSLPRANGELILIADDQDSVRDLLQIVLRNHGYQTVTAVDGADALAVFKSRRDDVTAIITDLHMPNTGSEPIGTLFRRIRADVPILFISGLGGGEPGSDTHADSKDPFLLKPFRPADLVEAVHHLLHPDHPPKA